MKLVIDQNTLSKILSICGKSLLVKANLPVLSNLLLEATKNKLIVTSTDLETAIEAGAEASVSVSGKITVVGKTFLEFITQLPEGKVTLEKLGEELAITSGSYSARLTTMQAEEFPAIPKIEKGHKFKITSADLVRTVAKVVFSAAQDEARPVLAGSLWETGKGKILMVATDGYRLSYCELVAKENKVKEGLKIIIPAKALTGLTRVIEDGAEIDAVIDVEIATNLSQINFKAKNIEYTSRLIEGEFPNWQKIIPSSFSSKATFSKEEFARIVKLASIFARDAGNVVKLKLTAGENSKNQGQISAVASASQVGSGQAQIDAQIIGAGGEIAFNYRYLLEALSAIGDEQVDFEMIESLNPAKITSKSMEDNFFHIVMPVRLQG